MIKSNKTTIGGILAILAVIIAAVQQYLAGGIAAVNWEILMTGIAAGAGLIFAKDWNVSNAPNPLPKAESVSNPTVLKG